MNFKNEMFTRCPFYLPCMVHNKNSYKPQGNLKFYYILLTFCLLSLGLSGLLSNIFVKIAVDSTDQASNLFWGSQTDSTSSLKKILLKDHTFPQLFLVTLSSKTWIIALIRHFAGLTLFRCIGIGGPAQKGAQSTRFEPLVSF